MKLLIFFTVLLSFSTLSFGKICYDEVIKMTDVATYGSNTMFSINYSNKDKPESLDILVSNEDLTPLSHLKTSNRMLVIENESCEGLSQTEDIKKALEKYFNGEKVNFTLRTAAQFFK